MSKSKINSYIIVEDTTLRDGEQSPGIAFNKKTKIKIFNLLVEIGIKWIELGIPAMKGEEVKAIKKMLERKNELNLFSWNRGILEDIKYSIDLGFKCIHIGLPTSSIHLKYSINKDINWLIKTATNLIKFCKDKDIYVSISAEDIGRTDINLLQEYAIQVEKAGADRLRLSDTVGILDYEEYGNKIKAIKQVSNIDIQCHCHNDFGLAVANTIAGLKAGAKYFHVCVNGIGERAGMPDLAQTIMILKQLYNIDLGIKTEKLTYLSYEVAKATKKNISPWQPIVGENIFTHESGIHTKGMLNNSKTFEPFSPKLVGGVRKFIIGKHSGTNILKYYLEKKGIKVKKEILPHCLELVRKKAEDNGGTITTQQLYTLYCVAQKKYMDNKNEK